MTADQLRKSILQQAIQGKLVPQDPNDEPASVLLEKIQAEKKRLIKEKKIKPNKNESVIFRGEDNRHYEKLADGTVKCIENEVPFEVPQGWVWCRLESLMQKVSAGSTPRGGRNVYVENGVKFIRSQNVYNEGLVLSNIAYITSEIHKEKSNSHVIANDLLLNITGASIGRCSLVPDDFDTANINQHVLILRLIDYSLKEFIHLAITSPLVFNQIMDMQVGGTKEGLSAEKANKLFIPIPPLNEQSKIIDKIHTLIPQMNIYSNLENDSKQLDEELPNQLKKSILQYAIQGKLVPQDMSDEPASLLLKKIEKEKKCLVKEGKIKRDKIDSLIFKGDDNKYYERIGKNTVCIDGEIPFEIPDNWEWVRLRDISIIQEGPGIRSFQYKTSGIQLLTVTNILEGSVDIEKSKKFISEEEYQTKYLHFQLNKGDIVCACSGGSWGKSAIYDKSNLKIILNTSTLRLRFFGDIANNSYLYYLTKSFLFKNQLADQLSGMQPNFGYAHYSKILIPFPPLKEQERITSGLKHLLNKITI